MSKVTLRKIAKMLLCILITAFLWLYIGFILTPKDYDSLGGSRYCSYHAVFDEPQNTLDVLFAGDSCMYNTLIPMELYDKTGITSYNSGSAVQSAKAMETNIREIFKTQTPKVLVIEVDLFYETNTILTGSNIYKYLPIIAPVHYHNRWKEVSFKDFYTLPHNGRQYMKGYIFRGEISGYQAKADYMQSDTTKTLPIKNSIKNNINNIVKLCNKKNIDVMLYAAPCPASWSNKKHNFVQNMADGYGINFLDLNVPNALPGLDFSLHMCDEGYHCNYYAATLITEFFGDYLKSHYDLPDRKTVSGFEHWNQQNEEYKLYMASKL